MPVYDYVCRQCGRRIEVMHGMHAPGPDVCEYCGGQLRKAIHPLAIHFKGSGWAKKDAGAASSRAHRTGTGTGAGSGSKSPEVSGSPVSSTSGEGSAGSTTGGSMSDGAGKSTGE
jgi:putative FmdB family regulatory protein